MVDLHDHRLLARYAAEPAALAGRPDPEGRFLSAVLVPSGVSTEPESELGGLLSWHQERAAGVPVLLEGADALESPSGLAPLAEKGLRVLGLVHHRANQYAGSAETPSIGVTELGGELVEEAIRLGMALDAAHLSPAAFDDLLQQAGGRTAVIVSHTAAGALEPGHRNVTDRQIRAIAGTGGVVGITFHATMLGRGGDLARFAEHAAHVHRIAPGTAAIGSDRGGGIDLHRSLESADARSLHPALVRAGLSADEACGVMGRNALAIRVWR